MAMISLAGLLSGATALQDLYGAVWTRQPDGTYTAEGHSPRRLLNLIHSIEGVVGAEFAEIERGDDSSMMN